VILSPSKGLLFLIISTFSYFAAEANDHEPTCSAVKSPPGGTWKEIAAVPPEYDTLIALEGLGSNRRNTMVRTERQWKGKAGLIARVLSRDGMMIGNHQAGQARSRAVAPPFEWAECTCMGGWNAIIWMPEGGCALQVEQHNVGAREQDRAFATLEEWATTSSLAIAATRPGQGSLDQLLPIEKRCAASGPPPDVGERRWKTVTPSAANRASRLAFDLPLTNHASALRGKILRTVGEWRSSDGRVAQAIFHNDGPRNFGPGVWRLPDSPEAANAPDGVSRIEDDRWYGWAQNPWASCVLTLDAGPGSGLASPIEQDRFHSELWDWYWRAWPKVVRP